MAAAASSTAAQDRAVADSVELSGPSPSAGSSAGPASAGGGASGPASGGHGQGSGGGSGGGSNASGPKPAPHPHSSAIQVIPKLAVQPVAGAGGKRPPDSGKRGKRKPAPSDPAQHPQASAGPATAQEDSQQPQQAEAEGQRSKIPGVNAEDLENITHSKGLGRFRHDPVRFMIRLTAEGSAFFLGSGWRNYDNYIGAKILYPGYTKDILDALRASPTVHEAITAAIGADMRNGVPEKDARKNAEARMNAYANSLVADLTSRFSLRFIAFVVNNLLVRLYHQGIYIKGTEFLALREAAMEAAERGVSMIFLPCHKSHVDYLVISYIFYRLGIALPHIAAGQNLNIPFVGGLLRKGGAFFIRRTFGNDPIYNGVFKAYLEELMSKGHNIEAFIEGTRSRTGKLLPPKFGILKIILEAVMSGRVKDVMICPMSIGYDKVIETESYVNELLGRPKEPESLGQLVNSTSVLQLKWGRIDVRFQKPWSLRSFVDTECAQRNPQQVVDDTRAHVGSSQQVLLRALGYRILSDINAVAVIMPSALVGTVILTLRGRGVSRAELVAKVDWVRVQILQKGGKVAEFGDPTEVIVDRVLGILGGDLIGERRDLLEPVYFVKKRFELSFYRNHVMHLFIAEAILCASVEVHLRNGEHVSHQQLLRDVSFLSQLLKREFIYPPGGVLENMNKTIYSLIRNGVISTIEDIHDREKFDFYCFLIWPFVETYWLSSIALFMLDPQFGQGADAADGEGGNGDSAAADSAAMSDGPITGPIAEVWLPEKEFVNQVQELAKTLYYEGELTYFESINKEILKNAVRIIQATCLGARAYIYTDVAQSLCMTSDPIIVCLARFVMCTQSSVGVIPRERDAVDAGFRRDKDGVARYSSEMSARLTRLLRISAARLAAAANSAAGGSNSSGTAAGVPPGATRVPKL